MKAMSTCSTNAAERAIGNVAPNSALASVDFSYVKLLAYEFDFEEGKPNRHCVIHHAKRENHNV